MNAIVLVLSQWEVLGREGRGRGNILLFFNGNLFCVNCVYVQCGQALGVFYFRSIGGGGDLFF